MPSVDFNKPLQTNWSTRSMPVQLLDRLRIVAAVRSRGGEPVQIQQVLFECLELALPELEKQIGLQLPHSPNGEH